MKKQEQAHKVMSIELNDALLEACRDRVDG